MFVAAILCVAFESGLRVLRAIERGREPGRQKSPGYPVQKRLVRLVDPLAGQIRLFQRISLTSELVFPDFLLLGGRGLCDAAHVPADFSQKRPI